MGEDLNGRVRNILFISCKKVTVDGISLVNSNIWNQHYLNCEDVSVSNINVFNHANHNNDGIDIDGCRGFILTNSRIDSDDDGICLKSTGPAACENVVISNCIVSSYANAIKCGTESTGGFKNINISNCIIKPSESGIKPIVNVPVPIGIAGISLEIVDGGTMEGVVVNNILINGTRCPIYVRLGNRARKYMTEAATPPIGQMRNIQLSNINAYNCGNLGSSITGIPGAKIENISLQNISVINQGNLKPDEALKELKDVTDDEKGYPQPTRFGTLPSYGLFIRHVKGMEMDHITFISANAETRVPVVAADVEQLSIMNLRNNAMNGQPEIWLQGVSHYQIEKERIVKTIN